MHPRYGKKTTEETKKKMSLSHGGTGIPYENNEYGSEFDSSLKEKVRFKDSYKCQICGCSQVENARQLSIHHIDYNKKNNNINNLVSLCISCHTKTSYDREYWKEYFIKIYEILAISTVQSKLKFASSELINLNGVKSEA